MKTLLKVGAVLLSASAIYAFAASGSLEQRIAPVGETCMAGDSCAAAVQVASGEARSGVDVYDSKCATCHATGAAGAPKTGDVAGWAVRVEKGMAVLHENAIKGFNGMPAKGLCFDCSDAEIIAAVDHMIDNSK